MQTGIAWVLIHSALPFVSAAMTAVLSFVNPLTAILIDGWSSTTCSALGRWWGWS